MIARKRAQEIESFEKWQSRTEYLKKAEVRARKEKLWTSNECYISSIQAFDTQNNSYGSNLSDRRERLKSLISSENENHEEIISTFAANLKDKGIDTLPVAVRGACYLKPVDKLSIEHSGSIDLDNKRAACDQEEFSLVHKQTKVKHGGREPDRIDSIADQKTESEEHDIAAKLEERKRSTCLDRQQEQLRLLHSRMEELQKQEEKAKNLSMKEDALLRDLTHLEELEKDRQIIEERCNQEFHGRALLRQHTSALRRRSRAIQTELEAELEWLARLKMHQNFQFPPDDTSLEQSIQKTRQMLELALNRERDLAVELDALYAHEAARLWSKREKECQQEAEARHELLKQVLEERRSQIEKHLSEVRSQQKRELESSEALLQDLLRQKSEETSCTVQSEESRTAAKQQLDAREHERPSAMRQTLGKPKYETTITDDAEAAYEQLLRQEAEKIRLSNDSVIRSKFGTIPLSLSLKPGGNIW